MKSLIITDSQGFHHVSPKFSNSPDDSKQGYKQDNIDKIWWEHERTIIIAVIMADTKGSAKRK